MSVAKHGGKKVSMKSDQHGKSESSQGKEDDPSKGSLAQDLSSGEDTQTNEGFGTSNQSLSRQEGCIMKQGSRVG